MKLPGDTYIGQAHFAGTGPKNTHCKSCAYWNGAKQSGRRLRLSPHMNLCIRFFELTQRWGTPIPDTAQSCRHYDTSVKSIKARRAKELLDVERASSPQAVSA